MEFEDIIQSIRGHISSFVNKNQVKPNAMLLNRELLHILLYSDKYMQCVQVLNGRYTVMGFPVFETIDRDVLIKMVLIELEENK